MASMLIRNQLGNKTFSFYLPCDRTTAADFCQNNLEGVYHTYEVLDPVDKGAVVECNKVTVTGKSANGHKLTFSFYADSSKNEDEIITTLTGKTFNQVKFDEVYIIGYSKILLGGGQAGPVAP